MAHFFLITILNIQKPIMGGFIIYMTRFDFGSSGY